MLPMSIRFIGKDRWSQREIEDAITRAIGGGSKDDWRLRCKLYEGVDLG